MTGPDRSSLSSARTVLEAQSQVLGIIAKTASEQVQPTDVLGVCLDADAYDDGLAMRKSKRAKRRRSTD